MHASRQSRLLYFIFCFLGGVVFSEYSVSLPFLLCMEITLNVFLPDGGFRPCDHGLGFSVSLLFMWELNQPIKVIFVGV